MVRSKRAKIEELGGSQLLDRAAGAAALQPALAQQHHALLAPGQLPPLDPGQLGGGQQRGGGREHKREPPTGQDGHRSVAPLPLPAQLQVVTSPELCFACHQGKHPKR